MRGPPAAARARTHPGGSQCGVRRVTRSRAGRGKSVRSRRVAARGGFDVRCPGGVAEPALFRRFPALAGRAPAHRPFLDAVRRPSSRCRSPALPELCREARRRARPSSTAGTSRASSSSCSATRSPAARGALVTTGGIGTHHGLATAIFARACGLATTLVLVDQPVTARGARVAARSSPRTAPRWSTRATCPAPPGAALRVLARARAARRAAATSSRPAVSSPIGNLGFVSAACELAEQVRAGVLPEPRRIFVPIGSGGTRRRASSVGSRLAGLRAPVVGVLVTDILPPSPAAPRARWRAPPLRRLRRARSLDPRRRDFAPRGLRARDAASSVPGYGAAHRCRARGAGTRRGAPASPSSSPTPPSASPSSSRAGAAGALPRGPVLFWHTFNARGPEARGRRAPGTSRRSRRGCARIAEGEAA